MLRRNIFGGTLFQCWHSIKNINKIGLIYKLKNTDEFKDLQILGKKLHVDQHQFDLLSVYKDLIDEMAWSRLFAYVFDPIQNHGLSQTAYR